jgi:hypothetical protein
MTLKKRKLNISKKKRKKDFNNKLQDDHDQHRMEIVFSTLLLILHMDKSLDYSLKLELNELIVYIDLQLSLMILFDLHHLNLKNIYIYINNSVQKLIISYNMNLLLNLNHNFLVYQDD